MKKQLRISLVTAAVLLAASSAAFAGHYKGENYKGEAMPAPCPTPLTLRDGFYLGGQVGYDSYRVRQSITASDIDGDSFSYNPVLNPAGWVGGVLAGYGQYFSDMYYIGGEIFINGSNANTSYNVNSTNVDGAVVETSNYHTKVSVGTSYGISLLPGMKLNEATLAYIRLGYNRARIKGSQTFTSGAFTFSNSNSNWSSGFNYGLGMESTFYPQWSARGEYTHTNYGSFNSGGSHFSPSDNQFMAAIIYHFA
ncbi:MAG: outer membrane beta-barrel protein [Gammaproteobacteria bacterium]